MSFGDGRSRSATTDRSCSAWPRICDRRACRPRESLRPDAEELETLNSWLDTALVEDDGGAGRVAIRRLNRAEYNNTIRDLIGLDLRPADEFPADDVGYGFDNIGDVLSTSPILLEMYLAAAEKVIAEAFRSAVVRERLLNPPADTVPRAFRKFRPPVRTPREDKVFRAASAAPDPELPGSNTSTISFVPSATAPSPACDARRADAFARDRAFGRERR